MRVEARWRTQSDDETGIEVSVVIEMVFYDQITLAGLVLQAIFIEDSDVGPSVGN